MFNWWYIQQTGSNLWIQFYNIIVLQHLMKDGETEWEAATTTARGRYRRKALRKSSKPTGRKVRLSEAK